MSAAPVVTINGAFMPPPVEMPVEAKGISAKKNGAVEKATQYATITSADTREAACEHLKGIAALKTEAESIFEPLRKKTYDAYQEVLSKKNDVIKPLDEAEKLLRRAIGAYDAEQQRLAEEASRLAREEEDRRQAELLEAQIEEAERCGASAEEVHAIISEPYLAPAPVAAAVYAPQKTAGISSPRAVWAAEITNAKALIVAIAEGVVPMAACEFNMAYLNGRARTDKRELKIPGVRAVCSNTVSVRRK